MNQIERFLQKTNSNFCNLSALPLPDFQVSSSGISWDDIFLISYSMMNKEGTFAPKFL
jgi:hypothetical protein